MKASFELEAVELAIHGGPIVGVDEAGRGPLAGPVVAAAVVLDPRNIPDGIADSKLLEADIRRQLCRGDHGQCPRRYRRGRCRSGSTPKTSSMPRSGPWPPRSDDLHLEPKLILVDGKKVPPGLPCSSRAIVQGDAKCLSIAAASIVAKVTRDRMMVELSRSYPHHGFERHKGYGTAEHHAAIERFGVTPHHRRSFRPVQLALGLAAADA